MNSPDTILSYEEFIEYYHKHKKLPLGIWTPTSSLNDAQIKTKYKKYLGLVNKQVDYSDLLWETTRREVYERDNNICRLWMILSLKERQEAVNNGFIGQFKTITPAHFIPKSIAPKLKYEIDNIYTLSLMFHSHIDDFRNPLTGVSVNKDEVLYWWKRIINNDIIYKKLKEGNYGG